MVNKRPVMRSVESAGPFATRGGDTVEIKGRNFGARGQVAQALYGPSGNLLFTAAQCEVLQDAKIQCKAAPGSGRGHFWQVTVGGQTSTDFAASTAYANPVVLTLSGTGVDDGSTAGDEKVTITGENFGPSKDAPGGTDFSTGNLEAYYGPTQLCNEQVPGCGDTQKPYEYQALECSVSKDHIEIVCKTAVGAGANHRWSVVVNSLLSTSPQSK